MVTHVVRHEVAELIDAVRTRPHEYPLAELSRLSNLDVDISIQRRGGESVAIITRRSDPVFERLTPREHEVATLVAAGFSNAQIASALFVSLATVKDHVHSILAKTELDSRAQMIASWYGGMRSHESTR